MTSEPVTKPLRIYRTGIKKVKMNEVPDIYNKNDIYNKIKYTYR